jgi:electron transfer flavoprotein beta subunit
MHIIVCIKSVVRSAPGGIARRSADNSDLNPFDRPAVEAALQLKNAHGGTVTLLSMGPPVASAALSEGLAMGADRAVLISDRALAGSDTLITSDVLAAGIQRLAPFAFVLFGVRSMDSDTGQVGPQTAARLKLPFIGGVKALKLEAGTWRLRRTMDDWEEVWKVTPPAAATIHARAFRPRAVSLMGIGRTYARPMIETWQLKDLAIDENGVGLSGSPTRVSALRTVDRNRRCRLLTGEPREQTEALLAHLNERGLLQ